MLHVCNAPSPAATSSIPIGRMIAEKLLGINLKVKLREKSFSLNDVVFNLFLAIAYSQCCSFLGFSVHQYCKLTT